MSDFSEWGKYSKTSKYDNLQKIESREHIYPRNPNETIDSVIERANHWNSKNAEVMLKLEEQDEGMTKPSSYGPAHHNLHELYEQTKDTEHPDGIKPNENETVEEYTDRINLKIPPHEILTPEHAQDTHQKIEETKVGVSEGDKDEKYTPLKDHPQNLEEKTDENIPGILYKGGGPEQINLNHHPVDVKLDQQGTNNENIDIIKTQIRDTGWHNIEHVFPKNTQDEWQNAGGLKVSDLLEKPQYANSERFGPLVSYIHKLEDITGLKHEPGENVNKYVNNAIQKASDDGKINDITFNPTQDVHTTTNNTEPQNNPGGNTNIKQEQKNEVEVKQTEPKKEEIENIPPIENNLNKEITLSKSEHYPLTDDSLKIKFSYNTSGEVTTMNPGSIIQHGRPLDTIFKEDYAKEIINWSGKNNYQLPGFKIEQEQVAGRVLYNNLSIYENISKMPEYAKESMWLRDVIVHDIKDISKYGDIVNVDNLPENIQKALEK